LEEGKIRLPNTRKGRKSLDARGPLFHLLSVLQSTYSGKKIVYSQLFNYHITITPTISGEVYGGLTTSITG
jgi:hypothetical protein